MTKHGAENYISAASWQLCEILKATNGANKEAQAGQLIWRALGHDARAGLKKWRSYTEEQREALNDTASDYLEAVLEYLTENF